MKKQIVFLMLTALMMGTIVPSVFADAALTNERFRATGKYDIVAAGVGLHDKSDGVITLNIPDPGTSVVVVAYLYWSGYGPMGSGDAVVDFEGSQVTVLDSFGPDLWFDDDYSYVYVADVTAAVTAADSSYTVEGVDFAVNFGAGLIVVYENDALPTAEAIILDGLDNFWFGWTDPRGPNSGVTSFTFNAAAVSRNAKMTLLAGGTEHDNRPNEIWIETGVSPAPSPDGNLINPASDPDGDYPLVGADGASWDTYVADVTVEVGDEWAAVQVESVYSYEEPLNSEGYYGRGTSGTLIAAGFTIPIPCMADGLSPGFWKHNIAVYLGENPGRYSVPHEGEPRITDEILEAYFDMIPVTAEDAYAALTAKGKGSGQIRLDMGNLFNAAAGYAPYSD
ncbi:MAG: DUF3344 domain-containing protein [Candidatus Bathyarchaeota archaeon]|nr:DUF3344 domain-containing protein [Candidatus Bathyarchaeum tardum]